MDGSIGPEGPYITPSLLAFGFRDTVEVPVFLISMVYRYSFPASIWS